MIENEQVEVVRVVEALNEIGLTAYMEPGAKGFIDGVRIQDGVLYVDPHARVSGLLHEAGHLATMPRRFRHYVSGDLSKAQRRMFEELRDEPPETPLYRAAIQCSDCEATAWAFAFGTHLGLSPETIIRDDEYDGEGEATRLSVVMRGYLGINGMAAAGFCTSSVMMSKQTGRPLYPKLAFWTQEL